jgi:hypothetical protein
MLFPVSTKFVPVSTESAIKTDVVDGLRDVGWLGRKANAERGANNSSITVLERNIVFVVIGWRLWFCVYLIILVDDFLNFNLMMKCEKEEVIDDD